MSRLSLVTQRIEALIDGVGRVTLYLALAMIALVASNVLLRYLFSTGSVWAQELEWHLLVPICLLGMAYAVQQGEHVRVDIFFANFPPRVQILIDLGTAVLFMVVAALVMVLSWRYLGQSWRIDEGSANPGGIPYRWALKAFIPFGFALFFLQSLADALRAAARLNA